MTSIFRRRGRRGYTVKYRDAFGRTRMRSFPVESKAKDFERTVRSGAGQSPFFKDWAQAWLKQVRATLRWGTFVSYNWAIKKWWRPRLDSLRLAEITKRHIKAVLLEALEGMSPRSVHALHTSLSSCLGAAVDDELIPVNVARGVPRALRIHPRNSAAPIRSFTLDEARLFLGSLDEHVPDWAAFFRLLALTGVRIGEALALRWDDIDWTSGRIYVSRSSARGRVDGTKTSKERFVDTPAALLEELRTSQAHAREAALRTGKPVSFIFPGQHGRPFAQRYPQAAFKRLLQKIGLPGHFTPHGLRHTFARLQLEAGAPLKYVQQQLGHRTISLTADLYGQWADLGSAEAAEHHAERLLSPLLSPLSDNRNISGKSSR